MKFKALLERWNKQAAPVKTAERYAIRLNLDDASRLSALSVLFPGQHVESLISDLLHAALEEVAAAIPYAPGPKIISQDEQGDPVYEDAGMTPRFVALTRQFKKSLEAASAPQPPDAP